MPLLEAHRLHKRFGQQIVLDDVSFSVDTGELAGIIGPNGAGKTTFFNVLTGRYRPERGRVLFDGVDITGHSPAKIARVGISRSFQLMNLFDSYSALDNVIVAMRPLVQSRVSHARPGAPRLVSPGARRSATCRCRPGRQGARNGQGTCLR